MHSLSADFLDYPGLLTAIAPWLGERFSADYIGLYIAGKEKPVLRAVSACLSGGSRWVISEIQGNAECSTASRIANHRVPEGSEDSAVRQESAADPFSEKAWWMGVPLSLEAGYRGCIVLASANRRDARGRSLRDIQGAASQLSRAVCDHLLINDLRGSYLRLHEAQRISQAISQQNTTKDVVDAISKILPGVMHCDRCLVLFTNPESRMLQLHDSSVDEDDPLKGFEISVDRTSDLTVCLREARPICVSSTTWHGLNDPSLASVKSALMVPLLLGYEANGVMVFEDATSTRIWSEQDIQIGHILASQSASALEKARLFTAARVREARYRTLAQIGQAITSAAEPERIFSAIIDAVSALTGERPARIFVVDEDRRQLSGIRQGQLLSTIIRLDEDSVASRAFHAKRSVKVGGKDCSADLRLFGDSGSLRSFLAVPMLVYDEVIGIMIVGERMTDRSLGQDGVALLETLCTQAAIAMEKMRLLKASSNQRRELELLSKKLLKVQEDERRRLARELHDETGQSLTAVKIAIGLLLDEIPPEDSSFRVQVVSLRDQIEETLEGVRRLAYELRPSILDDLGFLPTLRWHTDRFTKRTGIPVEMDLSTFGGRLDPEIETALYRVTQEILTNVARHSGARKTVIVLKQDPEWLEYIVTDDGVGFDPNPMREDLRNGGGTGLVGIRERIMLLGGACTVRSHAGQGTTVAIRIPLH